MTFLASRLVTPEEAAPIADEVLMWIDRHLGMDYGWPGNVRELEQCVINVLMHGKYHPIGPVQSAPHRDLALAVAAGALTLDELTRRYCTAVYARTRNYEQAARALGVDRRTIKSKLDRALLEDLDGSRPRMSG